MNFFVENKFNEATKKALGIEDYEKKWQQTQDISETFSSDLA